MIRHGIAYGMLSTRRRVRAMVLPVITTATGAFLVVLVLGLSSGIRAQAESLGHAEEIRRAVVLIAVIVLLVGVVEVAVCTTRTVASRTRELGVFGATGVRRSPVVAALLVEPLVASVVGALLGAVSAVLALSLFSITGLAANVEPGGTAVGVVVSVAVSAAAAVVTSAFPSWRAASQSPIHSLSSGG